VIGAPDPRFGERPVAFVVADREAAVDMSTLLARIHAHNLQRLGKFKQPQDIHLIASLPRTPTGKVLRRRLRDLLENWSNTKRAEPDRADPDNARGLSG
jgi:fatty-acyl-CoA synthase